MIQYARPTPPPVSEYPLIEVDPCEMLEPVIAAGLPAFAMATLPIGRTQAGRACHVTGW